MTGVNKCRPLIRATLLLAVAASIFAVPVCSQSNALPQQPSANPGEPQEQKQQKQPAATPELKAEPAVPAAVSEVGHEATREEQIESETKELFRLSAEMRAEVAKTYKDSLSLVVLKKAEQIEKLAKSLKALIDADIADNKHR